jgi:hypothetical protein
VLFKIEEEEEAVNAAQALLTGQATERRLVVKVKPKGVNIRLP